MPCHENENGEINPNLVVHYILMYIAFLQLTCSITFMLNPISFLVLGNTVAQQAIDL